MAVQEGDKIPVAEVFVMSEEGRPEKTSTEEIFAGKKVVLFAVPGAFTPTCSNAHLPGFVVNADAIKAKGVDSIICLAVNDGFRALGAHLAARSILVITLSGTGSALKFLTVIRGLMHS